MNIKELINKKLLEQLDYTGPERMDPELERRAGSPDSPFAKNPAFRRGAADVERVYSKSFNDILYRIRANQGKETLTNQEFYTLLSGAGPLFMQLIRLEEPHRNELIELAKETVLNNLGMMDDALIMDASLTPPSQSTVDKMKPNPKKIEKELTSDQKGKLESEVYKRQIINALIDGYSKKSNYFFEQRGVKAKLDAINPELYPLYKKAMPLIDATYYANESNMDRAAKGEGIVGAVEPKVMKDPDTGEMKQGIKANAPIFPILCHELVKGIHMVTSRKGYPKNPELRKLTLGQTETLRSETDTLRLGPGIVDYLQNKMPMHLVDGSNPTLKMFYLIALYQLTPDPFSNLFGDLISPNPVDNEAAKEILDTIIEPRAKNLNKAFLEYIKAKYRDEDDEEDDDDEEEEEDDYGVEDVDNSKYYDDEDDGTDWDYDTEFTGGKRPNRFKQSDMKFYTKGNISDFLDSLNLENPYN
jgi:hypothetical protein